MGPAECERSFRQESGRVLASLIRTVGDFDLAEEALQEAYVAALEHWPRTGVPDRPGAWLLTTARRLMNRSHDDRKRRDVQKQAASAYRGTRCCRSSWTSDRELQPSTRALGQSSRAPFH